MNEKETAGTTVINQDPPAAKTVAKPGHGKDGRLTRESMELIIRNGGSVCHKGNVISTVAGLPTAEDLASDVGDTEAIERIRKEKDAQIAQLVSERDALIAKASGGTGASGSTPLPADDLDKLTKEQLLEKAKEAGLTGLSNKSKAELIEALTPAK